MRRLARTLTAPYRITPAKYPTKTQIKLDGDPVSKKTITPIPTLGKMATAKPRTNPPSNARHPFSSLYRLLKRLSRSLQTIVAMPTGRARTNDQIQTAKSFIVRLDRSDLHPKALSRYRQRVL